MKVVQTILPDLRRILRSLNHRHFCDPADPLERPKWRKTEIPFSIQRFPFWPPAQTHWNGLFHLISLSTCFWFFKSIREKLACSLLNWKHVRIWLTNPLRETGEIRHTGNKGQRLFSSNFAVRHRPSPHGQEGPWQLFVGGQSRVIPGGLVGFRVNFDLKAAGEQWRIDSRSTPQIKDVLGKTAGLPRSILVQAPSVDASCSHLMFSSPVWRLLLMAVLPLDSWA